MRPTSSLRRLGLVLLFILLAFVGLVSWMVVMPGRSYDRPTPRLSAADVEVAATLRRHVVFLAQAVGPRSVWGGGLPPAVEYLSRTIRGIGCAPVLHTYEISGTSVSNVEVEVRGSTLPDEIVIVGAHYDSVDESPGADDNASGVAAVLELLRITKRVRPARTIRFVFFVNEEPPYFQTERMGSLVYADRSRARGEDIIAMLSVESIGFFSDDEGS
ncbi:MAG: M20/M25/M40 family metallo-hydrolase [Deltaproteobacteria bacterium]|nr:M20/M25/M40 family metallo-hydrolase [Deltaproteobacteria bacterium]